MKEQRGKRKFVVAVEGENYLLDLRGVGYPEKFGFFTTRWIEAVDAQTASSVARVMVENEIGELSPRNTADCAPRLRVNDVREVETFGEVAPPGEGFSFFPSEEN